MSLALAPANRIWKWLIRAGLVFPLAWTVAAPGGASDRPEAGQSRLSRFAPAARRPAPADTILTHAHIYTVNRQHPWAEALAISSGKLAAVGSEEDIAPHRGPSTRVVDAGGRLVLPGFTDCHIHFLEGAMSLGQVDLEGAKTVQEIQTLVKTYAAAHPGKGWVLGRGWTYEVFGAAALPDKKYLDEILPNRPALFESYDGHTYWVNSRGLQFAGITRDTLDPPNGTIVRDPQSGEPTGALKDAASRLAESVLPEPTRQEKVVALRKGMLLANRAGLVRIHALGSDTALALHDFHALDVYVGLRRQGLLTLRLYIAPFLEPQGLTPRFLAAIEVARRKYADDMLATGLVKIMLDGAVEPHTAAMLTPYADNPRLSGAMFWNPADYKSAVAELDRRGFQVTTHAIGEAAVRLALDAYENAARTNATSDVRNRVEHIETISAADVPRFGALGVVASMQPLHAYPDPNMEHVWVRNAGPQRLERAFGWQGIAKSGGHLAFGSDWPIVTLNPWEGLQTAVTRENVAGEPPGGWIPAQRVSLPQAIEAYTLGAAYAGHREKTEGSLEPGKVADLIVVSQDIFRIDVHEINKTEVLLTMVGGRVVYQAPAMKAAR